MVRSSWLLAVGALVASFPLVAQTSPWAAIPENALYETGDTWITGGQRFRLYGVQACLRGTAFTNASGQRRDCGEASLAMLISLIRDYRPLCAPVLEGAPNSIRYVTCVVAPRGIQSAGSRIDLGTALIASGFAFAALQPDGKPVHLPYFVAELDAKRAKAGLWAFADLPAPGPIILKTLRAAQPAASGAPR